MELTVTIKQAEEFITTNIRAGLVTMLHSDPGIGKSDLVRKIAEKFKLKLIDIRASQMDPTDINGFGMVSDGIAQYIPFDVFPLKGDTIPKGYSGFLIFFDEINSCSKSVEAALYKVILDRKINQTDLHPNTAIICAGNLATSGAIVNRQGTATQSRMAHLQLSVDPIGWVEWATKNDLDLRVISYISSFPDKLHVFDPKHTDKTFAAPRTWEFVSKVLKVVGDISLKDQLVNLAGIVGEGSARQFVLFSESLIELPSIEDIKNNPTTAKLSNKPSLMHATSHLVAAHINEKNIDKIMLYVARMPIEFQTITLQNALHRDKELLKTDPIQNWVIEKGESLL